MPIPKMLPAENQFTHYTVAAAATVTAGRVVELVAAGTIQNCATPDLGFAIARESGTAGQQVEVYLLGSVIPALVGTGGATLGNKAIQAGAGDGLTNAPAAAAGANTNPIFGMFLQTGAAGEFVGLLTPGAFNRESA